MLEIVQRTTLPAVQGGNEAMTPTGGFGLAPHGVQDRSSGERNGPPTVVLSNQAPRAVEDSDKYNKEKFIKNGAKEFVGRVDPIKAKNWINNMETTFRAMQVPHGRKTGLATSMLHEKAYHWWQPMEKSNYNRKGYHFYHMV